jgi:hypothetical protein
MAMLIQNLRRHCEERSDEAIHAAPAAIGTQHGLLRFARNDGEGVLQGLRPC